MEVEKARHEASDLRRRLNEQAAVLRDVQATLASLELKAKSRA
jgi:hypothetical protein